MKSGNSIRGNSSNAWSKCSLVAVRGLSRFGQFPPNISFKADGFAAA
jgi:hypothetical protein